MTTCEHVWIFVYVSVSVGHVFRCRKCGAEKHDGMAQKQD